ncbi:MAG TPA: cob(I)yrinic acid a,c-diamide adenosyltransferase [Phycisphaerae bacterium]|nr:cob(I)yrinic acid a,c-diamide adenosyltransferase [Phycisphaerae bacterium]
MALYTRAGDKGYTVLPSADGGTHLRLRKNDARLAALGTLDELNAVIGLCAVEAGRVEHKRITRALLRIQNELLRVGSMLAAIATGSAAEVRIEPSAVTRMEKQVDAIWQRMGPLEHFILPGGCELAGRLHLARTVARRAERAAIVALDVSQHTRGAGPHAGVIGRYLNRLSDLLFALARLANRDAGVQEVIWRPEQE